MIIFVRLSCSLIMYYLAPATLPHTRGVRDRRPIVDVA